MMSEAQPEPPIIISDRRRVLEVCAAILTGVGKFVFMDLLNWKLFFILVISLGWISYVVIRQKQVQGILSYWGFRRDNFKEELLKVLPFGIVSIISFFIIGSILGTINMTWHIIPILLIYPLWGTVQQFLVIGLVVGNLQDLKTTKIHQFFIMLIAAVLFAGVHYPVYWLIGGTFILALFYSYLYLKNRNVYVLGLFHGWIGGFFYYTVVNHDPYAEVLLKIQ